MLLALDEQTNPLFKLIGYSLTLFVAIGLIYEVAGLISLFALRILFKKADRPGWSAFIPVYNVFQMSKIATGKSTMAVLISVLIGLYLLPQILLLIISPIEMLVDSPTFTFVVSTVLMMFVQTGTMGLLIALILFGVLSYSFVKSYGKEPYLCRLAIFFAPFIFIIIGFSKKTEYVGPN